MQIGKLNKRIVIEQTSGTRDTKGGTAADWSPVAEVWASIEPLSGREYLAAMQVQSDISHRVRIWYRSGITAKMRVKFGTRILEIASVINPDERNVELLLMCRELA